MCCPASDDAGSGLRLQECASQRDSSARVVRRRLCSSDSTLWFRTVVYAAVVVMLAKEARCLQLSIDPANGAVHILADNSSNSSRGRSFSSGGAPSESLREFRDCGGNLTALSRPARLYSPGYPKGYQSNQLCRWVITADGEITLHFVNIEIEESPGCEYDNIDVLIGPRQVPTGKICGTITNKTIETNATAVTVAFKSDESYEEKGFFLEFSANTGVAAQSLRSASAATRSPHRRAT